MTGADGEQRFIEAPLQQRDDVRSHFGATSLPNAGFDVRIRSTISAAHIGSGSPG